MKSIFVTGAAAGIGRATAKLFASRGYFLGLYDRDEAGLSSLRSEIGASKCVTGALDVTDLGAFRDAVASFATAAGDRMDVLFNCAGILRMGKFDEVPPEDAHLEIAINVGGVVNGVYAALALLEKTATLPDAKPVIVSMSSRSAIYGTPEHSVYSATKFAVRGLTEALELELRPKGIRVTDVMPGYVATAMVHDQKIKSGMLDALGIGLTADDVATLVWKAAHGARVHWTSEAADAAFMGLGAIPRAVMKRSMR